MISMLLTALSCHIQRLYGDCIFPINMFGTIFGKPTKQSFYRLYLYGTVGKVVVVIVVTVCLFFLGGGGA